MVPLWAQLGSTGISGPKGAASALEVLSSHPHLSGVGSFGGQDQHGPIWMDSEYLSVSGADGRSRWLLACDKK